MIYGILQELMRYRTRTLLWGDMCRYLGLMLGNTRISEFRVKALCCVGLTMIVYNTRIARPSTSKLFGMLLIGKR